VFRSHPGLSHDAAALLPGVDAPVFLAAGLAGNAGSLFRTDGALAGTSRASSIPGRT
jgi:hypothetical protein